MTASVSVGMFSWLVVGYLKLKALQQSMSSNKTRLARCSGHHNSNASSQELKCGVEGGEQGGVPLSLQGVSFARGLGPAGEREFLSTELVLWTVKALKYR